MNKAKPFNISKQLILDAYQQVRKNKGSAGIDDMTLKMFHAEHFDRLYALWNKMSSGSYFPPPVKAVAIKKKSGGERILGIPTVSDRIAQTAVKKILEPVIEPHFHDDSYGYRPNKSALDAVAKTRERCWKHQWVIDLDIKGFFDEIDHQLLLRALEKHTKERWIILYVKRWLKADIQNADGLPRKRTKGTPQGGVISPLLANLFLHYAFDLWMQKNYKDVSFARYADDIIVHCKTQEEAAQLLHAIRRRMAECLLNLNEEKTKIIYCGTRKLARFAGQRSFDFLGYTFRLRLAQSKSGTRFVGFLPAISQEAKKSIRGTIKKWQLHRRLSHTIESLAPLINPHLRGWINYYGKFYRSEVGKPLIQVDHYLIRFIQRKYRKSTGSLGIKHALKHLGRVRKFNPNLFEHWRNGWIWTTG